VRPASVAAGLLPAGTVPTDAIRASIDAMHPSGWPAAPFWACAVRLRDGALVVFGREGAPPVSVGTAVAASCAIPGWFEPVDAGGERYVDGGAHSLTNLVEVEAVRPDLVLVSAPMARTALRVQLRAEMDRLRRRGIGVVAFRPTPEDERAMGLNAMDAERRAAVVGAVRASARRRIRSLGDRLTVLQ
jgi:NTE family protein